MIRCGLVLVSALNGVDAGRISVPEAEQQVAADGLVHHGVPVDGLWDLPEQTLTLRLLLSRLTRDPVPPELPAAQRGWGLVLARPGALGALRGPAALTERVLAWGWTTTPVVISRRGGVALVPLPLGPADQPRAIQWLAMPAQRPIFDQPPADAIRQLGSVIGAAAQDLTELGHTAGTRPEGVTTVRLGNAYPATSQRLVDQALLLYEAAQAGLGDSDQLLHSHAVSVRERTLLSVRDAALDAIAAAVSWPEQTLF